MAQNIFDVTRPRIAITGTGPTADPGALLNQVTRSLATEADNQFKTWQEATVKQASAAGELAGSKGAPEYKTGTHLTAEAFNEAAKKSYITNLETNASAKMAEFRETFKNDPDAYLKASSSYIDGMVSKLKESSNTEAVANLFSARLKLDQQAAGYAISKQYMSNQAQKIEVENERLINTLTTNSYRESGAIFSKDPTMQGIAIEKFALGKKQLEIALHTVLPDGTPVYTPKEVAKQMDAYHTQFYTRAVQDYVSTSDISDDELVAIMDGTFTADITGVGSINILNEVGADVYDRSVKDFTFQKVREKEAAINRAEAEQERAMTDQRKINGVGLMNDLLSGARTVTASEILKKAQAGIIDDTDAMAMIKVVNDPNASVTNDDFIVADLQTRATLGEDVSDEIRRLAPNMTGNEYKSLMGQVAKAKRGQVDDNEKWLVKQVLKTDEYGFPDPNSQKQAADIQASYRQMIADKMDPSLAYEKAQTMVDVLKSRQASGKYGRVPKYAIIGNDGQIDVRASFKATEAAFKAGKISYAEVQAEGEKLQDVLTERN